MKRMNRRGQQMTLGTIIAIVLGIAVLVFLIFGFSTGWNNMWSKITELGGGSVNVDDVVRGCEVACAGQSADAYCRQSRTVNYGNKTWEKGSCESLEGSSKINIGSCSLSCSGIVVPSLTSSEEKEEKKCGGLEPVGSWVKDSAACPVPKKDRTSEVVDDKDKGVNTVCCSD